jgi:hypothetical protein
MACVLRLPLTLIATSVKSLLCAATLGLLASPALSVPTYIDDGIHGGTHEALGISDFFGRWNGTIELMYDPDGAPAEYSHAEVLALIEEAFEAWTTVSGVRFEVLGVDAELPDDRFAAQHDGLVRISWGNLGGAAGRAGPFGNFHDPDLGYVPYEDGSIELSNVPNTLKSASDLASVLIHEVGHLLGLGHSDNPDSAMYANPYNFLRYPRPDDIRAAQVMYGLPTIPIAVNSPQPAWIYTPPAQASSATTQFLFKPNVFSASGAYFEVGPGTITSVASSTPDNMFVEFVGMLGGAGSPAIDVDATFIVVDPSGYIYSERDWQLDCPPNHGCSVAASVAQTQIMKTIPGTWKVYVVKDATNELLASSTLAVTTTVSYNQPPRATVIARAGTTPSKAVFTLTATDPEGDDIDVVWRAPGSAGELRDDFATGGSSVVTIDFSQTGTHPFYIEVMDDQPRYGDGPGASPAGEGFQTLLRVTVSLPAATIEVVSTAGAASSSTPSLSQQTLAAIATTPTSLLVSNSNGVNVVTNAPLGFTFGASGDQGASTKTSFRHGDDVIIAAGITPLAVDVGKTADVFIVLRSTISAGIELWHYRNSAGLFVPWPSVAIADLQPAATVTLKSTEAFEVFNDQLPTGTYRAYIGYRVAGGNTLYYSGQPLILNVTN